MEARNQLSQASRDRYLMELVTARVRVTILRTLATLPLLNVSWVSSDGRLGVLCVAATPYMKFLTTRHRELREQGVLKLITPREITATILCEWGAMTE